MRCQHYQRREREKMERNNLDGVACDGWSNGFSYFQNQSRKSIMLAVHIDSNIMRFSAEMNSQLLKLHSLPFIVVLLIRTFGAESVRNSRLTTPGL